MLLSISQRTHNALFLYLNCVRSIGKAHIDTYTPSNSVHLAIFLQLEHYKNNSIAPSVSMQISTHLHWLLCGLGPAISGANHVIVTSLVTAEMGPLCANYGIVTSLVSVSIESAELKWNHSGCGSCDSDVTGHRVYSVCRAEVEPLWLRVTW